MMAFCLITYFIYTAAEGCFIVYSNREIFFGTFQRCK
jgi:hypothetical protein